MTVHRLEQVVSTKTGSPTDLLDYAVNHNFGELHIKIDPVTGMKAIIAIHNTSLGPSLGGCRFIEYQNSEEALIDAMLLAEGMSYKAALAGLPLGGGKAVIIKPLHRFDRLAYMRRFAEMVHELGGKYITALDSGTELSDMDIIAEHTPYVASLSCDNGNPAPSTALGVIRGIEAAASFQFGSNNLSGLHVAIQGVGEVGGLLVQYLHQRGVKITVSDINTDLARQIARQYGATFVSPDTIHKTACDVFAPCALGGIINDITIEELRTSIVAGAANNQLHKPHHGILLHNKGILYVPDYVINAGGLIYAASKYLRYSEAIASKRINDIYSLLLQIFTLVQETGQSTNEIADKLARQKLGLE